jgi:hypothetical protein
LIVIQTALLEAVQEHPVTAVTDTVPVDPPAPTDRAVGEIEYVQLTPDWVTVKVCPATVKDPVLEELPVLAATV